MGGVAICSVGLPNEALYLVFVGKSEDSLRVSYELWGPCIKLPVLRTSSFVNHVGLHRSAGKELWGALMICTADAHSRRGSLDGEKQRSREATNREGIEIKTRGKSISRQKKSLRGKLQCSSRKRQRTRVLPLA